MNTSPAGRDRDRSNKKLAELARIFYLLGTDCKKNIDIIVAQTCEVFGAACSLYNRIDDKNKSLVVWSSHNPPPDLDDSFDPEGHICWEATIKGSYQPVILPDIRETEYYTSDPYVQKYNLNAYLGHPVKCRNQVIGSLCMVDTRSRKFSRDDVNCIKTLAAALSLEEERLALEQETREEKERYQTLIENANDAIYIIQDGLVKFANPKTATISGYSLEELKGLSFKQLIHPEDRERVSDNHFRRMEGENIPSTYSFKALDKKGDTVFVQINAAHIIWDNRPAILYCTRDITRITELENLLQRAEKMELIGTMAGGVAHDLNNILSGLVSYPELLLMQLDEDSPLVEPIQFMLESGLKAADIVQDLLTLTRRGISVEKVLDLNTCVDEFLHSGPFKRLTSNFPRIRFQNTLASDLLRLKGSPAHISKIIMNLVINAAEAILEDGEVGIETTNKYVDSPLSRYDSIKEGDYVLLKVWDTGTGIPEDQIHRIFEPFFTKKQMGRSGSGLGLSVVWNSVKDHSGYIEVNGRPEGGTVFRIYFPATREIEEEELVDFNLDDYRGSNETILVIDDIKEQRKIARDTLEMLGYQTVTVASGEKAIHFLETYSVDLILLDMKMEPGMDGLETYQHILKLHPDQKAVIASGFSESDRVKQALSLGAGQYIKKPYTIKNIAYALRKELHP